MLILQDNLPEVAESFALVLVAVRGGALKGTLSLVFFLVSRCFARRDD